MNPAILVTDIPSLDSAEFERVENVLEDFDACVSSAWMLLGSLSYRMLAQLPGTQSGLRDADIVLLPSAGQDPRLLLSPAVCDRFLVALVRESNDCYFYKLCHRSTGLWVDLFTAEASNEYEWLWVNTGRTRFRAQTVEESLFNLLSHLLKADANGWRVQIKHLYNAQQLSRCVEKEALAKLFNDRRAQLLPHLLPHLAGENLSVILGYVLSLEPTSDGLVQEQADQALREVPETIHGIGAADPAMVEDMNRRRPRASAITKLSHRFWRLRMKFQLSGLYRGPKGY